MFSNIPLYLYRDIKNNYYFMCNENDIDLIKLTINKIKNNNIKELNIFLIIKDEYYDLFKKYDFVIQKSFIDNYKINFYYEIKNEKDIERAFS